MVKLEYYTDDITDLSTVTPTDATGYYDLKIGQYFVTHDYSRPANKETGKQKLDRLSLQKMQASWQLFHQKTPTIIKVKQICKPIHRVRNFC